MISQITVGGGSPVIYWYTLGVGWRALKILQVLAGGFPLTTGCKSQPHMVLDDFGIIGNVTCTAIRTKFPCVVQP